MDVLHCPYFQLIGSMLKRLHLFELFSVSSRRLRACCLRGACIRVCATIIVCMGGAFNVQAALNCTVAAPWLNMFSGPYRGFFAFPDDAATLPIGARVGAMREVNLRYNCTGMTAAGNEKFGTGMRAVSGVSYHAATQTYTTPQLEARGLGYRFWWHEPNGHGYGKHNLDAHPNSNPTIDYPPVNWYPRPGTSSPHLDISTRVIFFKINNNFQNTNGANINVNISADLFRFYIAEQSAPTTPRGQVQTYTLNLTQFSSRRRVCTPLANQTINFAPISGDEMPASGVVAARTASFTLNFNCPYMAYYTVGFTLDGIYGVLDTDNGVFGIKQGPGYASGVGVQFQAKGVATSWRGDQNWQPNTWRVLKHGQEYSIPHFEYSLSGINLNPTTATRNKNVDFKVSYYRVPGQLTGGTVESRVVVRLVYR